MSYMMYIYMKYWMSELKQHAQNNNNTFVVDVCFRRLLSFKSLLESLLDALGDI